MSDDPRQEKPNSDAKTDPHPSISDAERTADGAEQYVTDLDFISTWDVIFHEPSDVYMHGAGLLFEGGAFEVGENYPRGV